MENTVPLPRRTVLGGPTRDENDRQLENGIRDIKKQRMRFPALAAWGYAPLQNLQRSPMFARRAFETRGARQDADGCGFCNGVRIRAYGGCLGSRRR